MTKVLNSVSLCELAKELELSEESLSTVQKFSEFKVSGLATLSSAQETDMCFVSKAFYLGELEKSKSKLIVITKDLHSRAPVSLEKDKIFLIVKDPMMAMAKLSAIFAQKEWQEEGIHPTAIVAEDAKLGKGVAIGPHCVVESQVELGDRVSLMSGSYIGKGAKIGEDCLFFSNVVVYKGTQIGSRVRVHANTTLGSDGFGYVQSRKNGKIEHIKIHHLGFLTIGDDVEIGTNTSIDRGTLGNTVIGNNIIIDNQVQIGHNCLVEDGSIICGSTGLAGNSILRKGASVGGFCRLSNGAEIGVGATLAGDSTAISKIPPGEVWRGNPAMEIKSSFRIDASEVHLPEIRRWFMKWKKSQSKEKKSGENVGSHNDRI